MPRIGDPAPQFTADTTFGTLKLEDFKGSWLILFSHPADFTPVCTTEFIAFADIHPDLRKLNCELMGLSVDSVYSHIAWVRNIKEKMDVDITFPVIADLNKEVATLYGMINPGESKTETSRAVFIIDDEQMIRAIIYYPLTTGRNMQEILRVVKALQTSDEHTVATPANWEPGLKVIMPPPKSAEAAEVRVAEEGMECKDWYFCKKEL
jgi:peroxiredoxin (alkyl hydroperoxide reductase subunit C)